MISLFHTFGFLTSGVGLVLGATCGSRWLGWIGGILGAGVGAYVGLVLGRLPRALMIVFFRREHRRRSDVTPAASNRTR